LTKIGILSLTQFWTGKYIFRGMKAKGF